MPPHSFCSHGLTRKMQEDGHHARESYMGKHSKESTSGQQRPGKFVRSEKPMRPARQRRSGQADSGGYFACFASAKDKGQKKPSGSKRKTAVTVVVGLVVVALLCWGAYSLVSHFFMENKALADGSKVTIVVEQGESAKSIAGSLKDAGLIQSADSFLAYVKDQDVADALKPGTYAMTVPVSFAEIVDMLVAGPAYDGVALTIPEGQTIEQTAALVEKACAIPASEFKQLAYSASSYSSEYVFLNGVYNNSMEGYLFPKTYDVPADATADDVIRMMLDQFQLETVGLDLTYAKSKNLDLFDIVTIASCIEEEAFFEEDRPKIASVIYNRLSQGIRLGLDVTVSYAVGKSGEELTSQDLDIDSPYNTRKNYGLPAGPISSPGLASIQAAANPAQTDYTYFILTNEKSGFYNNYDDFLAGKAAWQAGQ